jgi:hypothetical protein
VWTYLAARIANLSPGPSGLLCDSSSTSPLPPGELGTDLDLFACFLCCLRFSMFFYCLATSFMVSQLFSSLSLFII